MGGGGGLMAARKLDLGVGDVHQDAPIGAAKKRTMKPIKAAKRNALPGSAFALPSTRQYPVNDAAHAKNAMARLEQNKRRLTPSQYALAKRNILKAYKKFGIEHGPEKAAASGSTRAHIRAGNLSIHVRHMSDEPEADGSTWLLAESLELADGASGPADDALPVWNQLAKIGQWAGHPSGRFQITAKEIGEIVRNFRATENRKIPIDFEHASEADPTEGSIPTDGAPAQGWIIDLQDRGDAGLWGLVEWLPKAREYVRSKQYRFFSPAIRFNSRDRVTAANIGARMTSGALTNNPFLDGMAEMAASDKESTVLAAAYAHPPDVYMPKMRAALGMDVTATARSCMDRLLSLEEHFGKIGEVGMSEGVDLAQYMPAMRDMISAPIGCCWDEVFDVVKHLIQAAIGEHEIEEHGGETDDEEPVSSMNMRDTMADQNEFAVKLADATAKVNMAESKLRDAESTIVALRASETALKSVESDLTLKLAESKAKHDALAAEMKTLRDAEAARADTEDNAAVDQAMLTYKEKKGLTADLRPHLLSMRKSNPLGFAAMYPPIAPAQQYLMRTVVRADNAPSGADRQALAAPARTKASYQNELRTLSDKYVKEGMALDDAIVRASDELKAASAA